MYFSHKTCRTKSSSVLQSYLAGISNAEVSAEGMGDGQRHHMNLIPSDSCTELEHLLGQRQWFLSGKLQTQMSSQMSVLLL